MLEYLKKERETKTSVSTLPIAFVKLYNEGSFKQTGKCSNVTTIQLPSHFLGSATYQVIHICTCDLTQEQQIQHVFQSYDGQVTPCKTKFVKHDLLVFKLNMVQIKLYWIFIVC